MTKRTYLDSGVLMAAFKGEGELGLRAMQVLDDAGRTLIVSEAVRLELLPKPMYEKQREEVDFYLAVFDKAEVLPWDIAILKQAQQVAEEHGIAAMDAIHVAFARKAQADELMTTEKQGKPLFRVASPTVYSILEPPRT